MDAAVLAAGRGSRMGAPKHLLEIDGVSMLERVVRALRDSRAGRITVVLRIGDDPGRVLAESLGVPWALAAEPQRGRAASVRAGVEAAEGGAAGLLFALADQPYLLPSDFDSLIDAFASDPRGIVRATYAGEPGSPVLFARRFFAELVSLEPGQGGRVVAARHSESVCDVPLDPHRGRDLDRPEDLSDRSPRTGSAACSGSRDGYSPPSMERTLAIIKPDAVRASQTGAILEAIEASGLRLIALRMLRLSRPEAEGFYTVHRARPFFDSLVDFMTSGPVVVGCLEGEGAIAAYRELMGATDPAQAAEGTLRKRFATNIEQNACHGSDAPETAAIEIRYFFRDLDLVERD